MEHLVVYYLSQVSQTHVPTMQFTQSSTELFQLNEDFFDLKCLVSWAWKLWRA